MRSLLLIILCLIVSSFVIIRTRPDARKIRTETVYMFTPPHDHSGKLPDTSIYQGKYFARYDTGGRTTEAILYHYNKKDSIIMHYTHEYDAKGREVAVNFNGKPSATRTFTVDKNGDLRNTYLADGRKMTVTVSSKRNGIDTVYHYDRSGNVEYKLLQKFSAKRDTIIQDKLSVLNTFDHREIRIFDDKKRLTKALIFNADGSRKSLETRTYTRETEVRIDSNLMYIGGLPGDKMADKVFNYTIRIDKTDQYGNWTQRSFLFNKKYMLLSKRELEYHQ